jgi:hypothetical protein
MGMENASFAVAVVIRQRDKTHPYIIPKNRIFSGEEVASKTKTQMN